MPTAAYEVGGYIIDKTGTVTGPDNLDLEDALHQAGFDADGDTREYDEPDTYESGTGEIGVADGLVDFFRDIDIGQHHPGQYADPKTAATEEMMRQAAVWMEGLPEYEDLRLKEREEPGLEREHPELGFPDRLTIKVPLDGFSPEKLDNLARLISAKAPLLKAALGADDLPVIQTTNTLQFPWFTGACAADHAEACAALVSQLCKTAREKTRVTAKAKDIDGSQKYAMRCFLLSLGMIGNEYKKARKILLSRLEGNSSWKHGGQRQTVGSPDPEVNSPTIPEGLPVKLS
jgi:hypothetical protein